MTLFDITHYADKIPAPDARCKSLGTLEDWLEKWHPGYKPRCNRTVRHSGLHQTINRKDGKVLAQWLNVYEWDSAEGQT